MILEPKHKNFAGPSQIKETVKKRFNIRHHMSTPRAFECYYFKIILNWWHSPFQEWIRGLRDVFWWRYKKNKGQTSRVSVPLKRTVVKTEFPSDNPQKSGWKFYQTLIWVMYKYNLCFWGWFHSFWESKQRLKFNTVSFLHRNVSIE